MLMGAGGAAALATLASSKEAQAGHDGSNVCHLGEFNETPAGTGTEGSTFIGGNATAFVLEVNNDGTNEHSGGVQAFARRSPGVQGNVIDPGHSGVMGVSWASGDIADFAKGSGDGVKGLSGSGSGVIGESQSGPGVFGHSETFVGGVFESNSGNGVRGESQSAAGVSGHSDQGVGAKGESNTHFGLRGESGGGFPGGVGVFGFSHNDVGLFGVSDLGEGLEGDGVGGFSQNGVGGRFASALGIGLRGVSPGDDLPAVQAASGTHTDPHFEADPDGGLALEVIGKSRFSTAGASVVPAGQDSVFVENAAVTADSHISVTLVSDPGPRNVAWVEREPGNGFTLHMSSAPPPQRPATSFTYLVVEPA